MTSDRWLAIRLPYATFALGVRGGRVAEAPPIARWTIGKDWEYVAHFYAQAGAEFAPLPDR
jgi:hypothetical protein